MTLEKHNVFIDGEAGTTGLQIRERLALIPEINVLSIAPEKRKDPSERQSLMRQADAIILCLPDDAAREAVALANDLGTDAPRIIDASTAHRTADGWTYGFAEMARGHGETIANAQWVANPGCYPTGAIALLRPLIESGQFPADHPFTINAVSGYSGGGKSMIAEFEGGEAPAFHLYALGLEHKHLPEIVAHAGLKRAPIFVPSVGNFAQGMLVSVPLHLDVLDAPITSSELKKIFEDAYAEAGPLVHFVEESPARLPVDPSVGSDGLELFLFANDTSHQVLLVARLDNLGKGAAGAAVQNLNLMLGLKSA